MTGQAISTVAVLAGGLATRMRPLTETVPKALLDVAGEPFVAHQLRLFKREGIERVVLCLGYLGEQVVDFIGDGSRFGVEVVYCFDGERLLGTGGALRKALPLLPSRFFVTYGDSYLDIAYAPVAAHYFASGKEGLMTVFGNNGRWDHSNVAFEAGTIVAYSKTAKRADMQYIDYGLGILTSSTLLSFDKPDVLDLATVYGSLVLRQELAGYEAPSRFYEIGSIRGLVETRAHLAALRERRLPRI